MSNRFPLVMDGFGVGAEEWFNPVGEAVTELESDVDVLGALATAWLPYTPVWSSTGTQPVLGNGTITGAYKQLGKWVQYRGLLTMGASTTYGTGFYRLSLPVTAVSIEQVGVAQLLDTGTQDKPATVYASTTSLIFPISTAGAIGPTVPHTWAVGDLIRWYISYEAA